MKSGGWAINGFILGSSLALIGCGIGKTNISAKSSSSSTLAVSPSPRLSPTPTPTMPPASPTPTPSATPKPSATPGSSPTPPSTPTPTPSPSATPDALMTDSQFQTSTFITPIGIVGDLADWDPEVPTAQMITLNANKILATQSRWFPTGQRKIKLAAYLAANVMSEICIAKTPRSQVCQTRSDFDYDFTEVRKDIDVVLAFNRDHPSQTIGMFFHINSGNWSPDSPLIRSLQNTYGQLDQRNELFRDDTQTPALGVCLTMSARATAVRDTRSRNIRKAMDDILKYLESKGALKYLVGFDSSSENGFSAHPWRVTDYNSLALQDFRDYLVQKFGSLTNINNQFGTSFSQISQIDPPRWNPNYGGTSRGNWDRQLDPNNPYWVEFANFRYQVVDDYTNWEVGLIATSFTNFANAKGMSRNIKKRVFSHQVARPFELHGDRPANAVVSQGTVGVTLYGFNMSGRNYTPQEKQTTYALMNQYSTLDSNWMVNELNPMTNILGDAREFLEQLFANKARLYAPFFYVYPQYDQFPAPGSVGIDCLPGFGPQFPTVLRCADQSINQYLLFGTQTDAAMAAFISSHN